MSRNPVEQMSPTAKRALIALMAQRIGKLQELLDALRRVEEHTTPAAQSRPPTASAR